MILYWFDLKSLILLQIIDIGSTELVHAFTPCRKDDDEKLPHSEPPITKMFTSADGQWLAAINCFGDVYIFNLETLRYDMNVVIDRYVSCSQVFFSLAAGIGMNELI